MKTLYFLVCLFFAVNMQSQILNAYAKITAITGGRTILTLSNVNETSHTFVVGGKVIVMQMQDDAIGTNTTNVASFGNLDAISKSGKYEVGIIASRSPAVGTPTSITLSSALATSYNIGTNASVQLITLRGLGVNYTTTATITGLAWDGNVGGVVALEISNTLTVNHSIHADAIGFRGGATSASAGGGCQPSIYMTSSNLQGFKGEGIYKSTNANFTNGRGKILNGGGGGNEHNAGGGGGGNVYAGGAGGLGYACGASNSGGLGGIALGGHIGTDRIFMGGGGGGGGQNNGVGSRGGNGGGIVFIKAKTITTNAICPGSIRISANGETSANVANDGAGGAGAGGTVVLQVDNYNALCSISIQANGGNGGNCNDGTVHAGGGGGSQGAVLYSTPQPTTNITTTTTNGTPGKNNSSGSSSAGSPGGSNNNGIAISVPGPLPIELLSFTGEVLDSKYKLLWVTASEFNNDYFTVEKSVDGINFSSIGNVKAVGNALYKNNYELYDVKPTFGVSYYRLKQTDLDKKYTYSKIITLVQEKLSSVQIYPNPSHINEPVFISFDKLTQNYFDLEIYNMVGEQITSRRIEILENETKIQINDGILPTGMYIVRVSNHSTNHIQKLIIN